MPQGPTIFKGRHFVFGAFGDLKISNCTGEVHFVFGAFGDLEISNCTGEAHFVFGACGDLEISNCTGEAHFVWTSQVQMEQVRLMFFPVILGPQT